MAFDIHSSAMEGMDVRVKHVGDRSGIDLMEVLPVARVELTI